MVGRTEEPNRAGGRCSDSFKVAPTVRMLTCSLMLWHGLHGAGAMPGGAAFALQIRRIQNGVECSRQAEPRFAQTA